MKPKRNPGRPKIGGGVMAATVSLTQLDWDCVLEWGEQNASKGIRKAIQKARAWDKAVRNSPSTV